MNHAKNGLKILIIGTLLLITNSWAFSLDFEGSEEESNTVTEPAMESDSAENDIKNKDGKIESANNEIRFFVEMGVPNFGPLYSLEYARLRNVNKYIAFSWYLRLNLNQLGRVVEWYDWFYKVNTWAGSPGTTVLVNILLMGIPYVVAVSASLITTGDMLTEGCDFRVYPYRNSYFDCYISLGIENNPYQLYRAGIYMQQDKQFVSPLHICVPFKVQAEGKAGLFRYAGYGKMVWEPFILCYKLQEGGYAGVWEYFVRNGLVLGVSIGLSF